MSFIRRPPHRRHHGLRLARPRDRASGHRGAGYRLIAGPPAGPGDRNRGAGREAPACGHSHQLGAGVGEGRRPQPNLRIIGRLGVSLDNIAVDEATRRGIWVTNVPDYCFEEVADHSVGMLLSFTRGLMHFDREVKAGRWEPSTARLLRMSTPHGGDPRLRTHRRSTAQKLNGFGAKVLAHTRSARSEPGVEFVSLDRLLKESDAVIVHIPLTPRRNIS